jgi:hypothetical protein
LSHPEFTIDNTSVAFEEMNLVYTIDQKPSNFRGIPVVILSECLNDEKD